MSAIVSRNASEFTEKHIAQTNSAHTNLSGYIDTESMQMNIGISEWISWKEKDPEWLYTSFTSSMAL